MACLFYYWKAACIILFDVYTVNKLINTIRDLRWVLKVSNRHQLSHEIVMVNITTLQSALCHLWLYGWKIWFFTFFSHTSTWATTVFQAMECWYGYISFQYKQCKVIRMMFHGCCLQQAYLHSPAYQHYHHINMPQLHYYIETDRNILSFHGQLALCSDGHG